MFVITSAEVRWFSKGEIPPAVFDWFIGLNENYVNQSERTDYYLHLPSIDSLGIKHREGRIEIKKLIKRIGQITPGMAAAGVAEKWRKWSFEINETAPLFSDELQRNEWIPIRKNRILINYGITNDNITTQKEPTIYQNGCITEITSVSCGKENWWTLGLEAYGEESRLLDNLVLISHLILSDKSHIHLTLNDSLSYPGWMQHMYQK